MDKNAIKKFAVWARRELISRVSQRAAWYGITEKDPIDEKVQAIHGHVLTPEEQAQRRALIWHIRKNGYQQVMEEVAYTWFNRFIALRFMEVNGYLPSYTRVFSDESGAFNPQILKDAIHLDIEGLDMEKVYAMEEANETETLFKYLVITQCNDLNRMLPGMFQKISDYTELLFPDFLLREGSVAHQMVATIPEEDWKDAVQIIGWLYQYYNAEPKDEVFAALKKNIKISKEKIPAATQLFTPDWIVRYMVENSLGRLWVEGHPNDELKANWKYYLEEAPQEPEVEAQLKKIRAEYAQIDPASILCCDPCMGSGHILVYMFDVLMQIYLAYGYTTNEAVESIVRNNLWGMDIDDRAAQLAYFAVMMKAQQYDHRWLAKQLRHPVQPNVFALQDSGDWPTFERQIRQAFTHHPSLMEETSIKTAEALFETFADAKEFGSIIQPEIGLEELNMLENTLDEMAQKADLMDFVARADAISLMETLRPLIQQCRGLAQKYHVVVTNPPYMNPDNVSAQVTANLKGLYPDSKTDLYAVFIERCKKATITNYYCSMVTMNSWMFLGSYENLRKKILSESQLISLNHLGMEAFEGIIGKVVQTVAFAFQNKEPIGEYKARAVRLTDFYDSRRHLKETEFFNANNRYSFSHNHLMRIPGKPLAYWTTDQVIYDFESAKPLNEICETRKGLATSDNDRFLRFWHEVDFRNLCLNCSDNQETVDNGIKWYPENKGGDFRRWYGNREYIINWENDGYEIRNYKDEKGKLLSRPQNTNYNFKQALTWSKITTAKFSARFCEGGFLFDDAAAICHHKDLGLLKVILGFLNAKCCQHFLNILNPTQNKQIGDIGNLPILSLEGGQIDTLVDRCIMLSRADWDSFETSWDFQLHPIVRHKPAYLHDMRVYGAPGSGFEVGREIHAGTIEQAYMAWWHEANERFAQLKANEEELNRIFINIYGLQDELTPDVDDKDVTVRKADLDRDIRSLISYAVGCMLGRYSLDKPGLAFAGGTLDESQYMTYHADHDGILPITDDEYFDDDIVGMFIDWVRTVFGAETLEANLKFIADALGGKGNPREVIRQYFLNDFYKDHLKIYQKRPIYWLFDSGKKNGFKCLIYMHRYQPDTIARIRTDYLHETQARYRNAIETLERQSASASTGERVKMTKRLNALKAQAEEARIYEEKIHHLADQMIKIDLDDGVKVNYAKFQDVLAPIK